ncbi:hypothetical protein AVEN_90794-1 [Araneus ventricosus]|uniref:Uncharacterized protein n=1 Tax=Araneus ventricosus TaxID=182803 RepID=A0A4Y2UBH0_ARAVE|nr:hypothetical protein AVEN_90794-1 [Araneus ventricosus]
MIRPPRQLNRHCGTRFIALITSSHGMTPQTEVRHVIGRGNSTHTITISHREARLCLLIEQCSGVLALAIWRRSKGVYQLLDFSPKLLWHWKKNRREAVSAKRPLGLRDIDLLTLLTCD